MESKLNLGQYVSDLISLSSKLQKTAASDQEPLKVYQLAVEIKDTAKSLQNHLIEKYLEDKCPR